MQNAETSQQSRLWCFRVKKSYVIAAGFVLLCGIGWSQRESRSNVDHVSQAELALENRQWENRFNDLEKKLEEEDKQVDNNRAEIARMHGQVEVWEILISILSGGSFALSVVNQVLHQRKTASNGH